MKPRLIAALGVAWLCGCSASPNASLLLPSTAGAARTDVPKPDGVQGLTLRIRVPRRRHRDHYVSPATRGAALTFSGPSTLDEAIGLTPGTNPGCKAGGGSYTCTLRVRLAAGKYVGSISTYDAAPAGGSIPVTARLLSAVKNVPFTIARAKANQLNFVLDGVPASITVGGFPVAAAGSPFSNSRFTVNALDAGGDVIVGTYATPIVLVDTDGSGNTSIATSGKDSPPAGHLLGSSDTATISYNGHVTGPARIDASSGSATGFGILSFENPLVVTNNLNTVSEFSPSCSNASCGKTLGGGFAETTGVAVDVNGNVFVADASKGTVDKIPSGCTSSSCVVTIGGGFSLPFDIAVDSSDNVYVADKNNSAVKQIPNGCKSSSCVNVLGGGFIFPIGVGVDGSGNVFVGDTGHNEVKKIPAGCTSSGCVVTLGGGFNGPQGVAPDASGGVYVADSINHAVKHVPSGCVSSGCVTTVGGGFNAPTTVAYDGTNVFVADYTNQLVEKIPAGCASSACVSTIIGNLSYPYAIAIP